MATTHQERLEHKLESEHRQLADAVDARDAHKANANSLAADREFLAKRNRDVANPRTGTAIGHWLFIGIAIVALFIDAYALAPFAAWVAVEMAAPRWAKWLILATCMFIVVGAGYAVHRGLQKAKEDFNGRAEWIWRVVGMIVSLITPVAIFVGALAGAVKNHVPWTVALLVQPYLVIAAVCSMVFTLAVIFIPDAIDDAVAYLQWKREDGGLARAKKRNDHAAERFEREATKRVMRLKMLRQQYTRLYNVDPPEPPMTTAVKKFVEEQFHEPENAHPTAAVATFSPKT